MLARVAVAGHGGKPKLPRHPLSMRWGHQLSHATAHDLKAVVKRVDPQGILLYVLDEDEAFEIHKGEHDRQEGCTSQRIKPDGGELQQYLAAWCSMLGDQAIDRVFLVGSLCVRLKCHKLHKGRGRITSKVAITFDCIWPAPPSEDKHVCRGKGLWHAHARMGNIIGCNRVISCHCHAPEASQSRRDETIIPYHDSDSSWTSRKQRESCHRCGCERAMQ